jgi:hypothetical protein
MGTVGVGHARVLVMRRIGAIFTPYSPPEALPDAAQAAEDSGVPELWLWEDCFRESAFAAASAVLAWTTTLKVGIGVAPMPLLPVPIRTAEPIVFAHGERGVLARRLRLQSPTDALNLIGPAFEGTGVSLRRWDAASAIITAL